MQLPRFRIQTLMIVVGAAAVFFAVAPWAPLAAIVFLPPLYLLVYLIYRRLTNPPRPERSPDDGL